MKQRKCRYCGCTDAKACEGGCYWMEGVLGVRTDVCSQCHEKREAAIKAVREWHAAYEAFVAAPETEMPAAGRRCRLAKSLAVVKLRVLRKDLELDGRRYHVVPSRQEIQIKILRGKKGAR